jgi:hypothetical protein
VTGFGPDGLHAGSDRDGLLVGHGLEAFDDGFGQLGIVKRFQGRFPGALALAVLAFRIGHLDAGGVAENERGHLDGGRGGKDRAGVAEFGEQRQAASVVQVTVRDQDSIEFAVGIGGGAVQGIGLLAALKQPAVHEHASLGRFDEIGRAGDFPSRGANDVDFHDY